MSALHAAHRLLSGDKNAEVMQQAVYLRYILSPVVHKLHVRAGDGLNLSLFFLCSFQVDGAIAVRGPERRIHDEKTYRM